MRAFADLSDLPEDERIEIIARTAKANSGAIIGVAVDDEPAKVERYRRKLIAAGLRVVEIGDGPVAGSKFIRVAFTH